MPFEAFPNQSIAVIGAGISGLAAAYQLSRHSQVTLFEASENLGGHARTVMAGKGGDVPVDTGFIVFNYHTYPGLSRLFSDLEVPVKKSDMSFGVSIDDGKLEYGTKSIRAAISQKRNVIRPDFWKMVSDIIKFNRLAPDATTSSEMTIDDLLSELQLGRWFREYYLLPMSGAIWSSTPEQIGRFPARSLIQFFENHALLTPRTHQWYTVDGGSREYVSRIHAAILQRGATVKTKTKVHSVRRDPLGVSINTEAGRTERFDRVVFASHSDQTLSMLADATKSEKSILGRIKYQDNLAILHSDKRQMPKRKSAWSSWVYRSNSAVSSERVGITYWMNSLQGIDDNDPMFVSLNPTSDIREDLIYDEKLFRHPVFDHDALQAQKELSDIQGRQSTWFCGAWTRYGFHEDGYESATAVARQIASERMAA